MDNDEVTIKEFLGKALAIDEEAKDPFNISMEKVHALTGLSPATKRVITQKFLRGKDGAESKQTEYFSQTSYDLFKVAIPPYNIGYLAKLYEVSPYHHAAVDAKASNIVGLGFDLIESSRTKQKIDEESDTDKVSKMRKKISRLRDDLMEYIDSLNEDSFLIQTLTRVVTDYEVTGNGYIEIGRTVAGKIGYIGHVPSTHMRVRLDRDGYIQIIGSRYTFFRNFGDTQTPDPLGKDDAPNEIIHLKNYTPTNTYYGVSDVISAKGAVAGNEFATRFNLDYFEYKAVPRYIITLKGAKLDSGSEQKLLEFFETNLKGQNHRSLYIPLPADDPNRKVEFKMDAVENNVQEGSFNNYQKLNRDEILMAHRVPISKIGIPDGVSLAIARDADKTFKEQVCGPTQRLIEKKINQIIAEFTDVLTFKLNELTLTDEDTQSRIDERYLRMQTITPNEIRTRKGMPGIEGGDTPIQLNARAAAEQTTQATGNRQRDQQREANAPDQSGEARQPKGDGRVQE